jgi:leucyl aminopeptidase
MEFKQELNNLSNIEADAVVVFLFQDQKLDETLKKIDSQLPAKFIEEVVKAANSDGFKGKTAQLLKLPTFGHIKPSWLVIVGIGKSDEYTDTFMRRLSAQVCRRYMPSNNNGKKNICFVMPKANVDAIRCVIEGWLLASYSFQKYKSKPDELKQADTKCLSFSIIDSKDQIAKNDFSYNVSLAETIASATNFARELVAEPPADMTPTKLAQIASELKGNNLSCEIMDRSHMEKLKMGAFLGVARGASEPPKFIVLKYKGDNAKRKIAIVGKGVTFDSGGLSLKNPQSMETMKYDMTGAAVVIAVIKIASALKLPLNIIGAIGATENMPGPNALHPGDVVIAANGKTIEVNNTDAEGRLILADVLSYIAKEKPDEIIDIATLTGAVVTALGRVCAGIMGNNDELIENIISAGTLAGEKYWQLPLLEEYEESLKSDIADLKNAGSKGAAPSSCAGMFLKEFVDSKPWAHLDIAGPAWREKEKDECNKGGTAFGVRTLSYYLLSLIK